jgi:hypothetical protein
LLDYRKNKYDLIAKKYGYRVKASEIALVENESDFIGLVAKAIKSNE